MSEYHAPAGEKSPHWYAAWWSSVAEPADTSVMLLRSALGDEQAIAWAKADEPRPLPVELLGCDNEKWQHWVKTHERWLARAQSADPDADFGVLEGIGGCFIIPSDSQWPQSLADLGPAEPVGLWMLGKELQPGGVALVGARACTQYGTYIARECARGLAQQNIPVVSGGAFGIDIAAHTGALDASGYTVAVMAGGLGELYPATHRDQFRRIVDSGGTIITEAPPLWRPARWRFLQRNRLIAALASATVVIEAGVRSGALSTARHALEIGREVGAVPGMVTQEMSKGCNELLRQGATLVRDSRDIIQLLPGFDAGQEGTLFDCPQPDAPGIESLPPDLRRVWDALPQRSAMPMPRLVRVSGLGEREVLAALAGLELSGLVRSSARGWSRSVAK